MTDHLDTYQQLKQGDYQDASVYMASVKQRIERQDAAALRQRVEKVLLREDVAEIVTVTVAEDGYIDVVLRTEYEDGDELVSLFRLHIADNQDPEAWAYDAAEYRNRNLLEDERLEMQQAAQTVECITYFDLDDPQISWMLQLAVLDAVAGECYAVQDMVSGQFFSGTWLAEMAQTHTPPSLEMAYVIHVVTPENDHADDFWMHTHGLLKFGMPELEILRARREQLENFQNLINSVSQMMLDDNDIWQTDEAITCAQSEQGMVSMRLMPWQSALRSDLLAPVKKGLFKRSIERFNGDLGERADDDVHSKPSLVVFGDNDGQMVPLSAFDQALAADQHLMFMLPNAESERMHWLAQEKLPLLASCLKRHPPIDDAWTYIMKICCESEHTGAVEHMWFKVAHMTDTELEAELLNEPFNIPEMHQGTVYVLPVSEVTDWCIYSEPLQKRITPDDAFHLRRYLNAA